MRSWTRLPERGLAAVTDRTTGGFLTLAAVVGVGVGLGAGLLVWFVDLLATGFQRMDEDLLGGSRWYVVVLIPLAILAAWWIAERYAPEVSGDGVPEATAGLAVKGGYLSTKSIPFKILVTALTLGAGGSGGREGPVVQVGSAIGSSISRRFHLGEDQIRSLVAAGAGAAIGASFNAPIAGMLFAMEVILGSFSVRHLSAVVLASVSAAVTFRRLPLPEESVLSAKPYDLQGPNELILYAGLAVVAVVVAVLFLKLIDLVETRAHAVTRHRWVRPVGFGVVVGLIGMVEPRVLGTGQAFVSELLQNQLFEGIQGVEQIAWSVLLLLVVGKVIATSFTIASGGSGGAFMPSLFIGAALGAGYAELAQKIWSTPLEPGAFAVVGMATVFAAVARAPLTAILIVFEITGARDYGLVLPLMLSATFATFMADRVHPESVYTLPLARRGIKLARTGEVDLLDTVSVGQVMTPSKAIATPGMTLAEAAEAMDRHRYHGLPVVDEGQLVGIISVSDVNRTGGPSPEIQVLEAMTRRPVTVSPTTPVSRALERMAVLGVGRLPVVADEHGTHLVGMFRREDAVRAYHQALGLTTDHQLRRARLQQRTDPGASYFDFRVPRGSIADGREVREVAWPEGCTLVSVRRGTEVMVPSGGTALQPGDVITAFGTRGGRQRLISRLNAGADEPTAEISVGDIDQRLFDRETRVDDA